MTKLAENNPQGTANIADDRVLATVLLMAIKNKDWSYMLSIFPEGVEHRTYKYTTEEHFTEWETYEDYTRYNSCAQDMMIEKCLDKVIKMLS